MDWNKQAETVIQTWSEAQRKMWGSWLDLNKDAAADEETPFAFYANMIKQWQEMTNQGMQTWISRADPAAQNLARQIMTSQEALMRFMQAFAQTWKAIMPKIEAGEDWQSALKAYSEQWVNSLTGIPTNMLTANKDINQLWQLYVKEWQNLGLFWLQSWQEPPKSFSDLSAMLGSGTELGYLSNLHWDAYERVSSSLTDLPSLGYNREFNLKLANAFDTWVDLQRASNEYRIILSKAWAQAFENFVQTLIDMGEKDEVIDSMQDLMNLWFDTVDQTFTHMYVTEDYLTIQQNLAAAAMTHKMQQQEIFELFMKMVDMPTRSELDDAYRSIYELHKEVKALRKELKATQVAAPAQPALKKTTSKSQSARKKSSSTKETNGKAPETGAETVAEDSSERS
jgi:class III poly(R)-hydroxyalkanoic acid synthase PhaE subunit